MRNVIILRSPAKALSIQWDMYKKDLVRAAAKLSDRQLLRPITKSYSSFDLIEISDGYGSNI